MRKLNVFMHISLDGYYAGPDGEIDWTRKDAETNAFAAENTNSGGELVFGRETYELMFHFWPTPAAYEMDPVVATYMNNTPKIVVSRTLEKAEWQNTRLVKENPGEVIAALKQQPGKDLTILGSSKLTASLIDLGLVDGFQIMVNPVILGDGRPVFKGIRKNLDLELLDTKIFSSGTVLYNYRPLIDGQ